MMGQAMTDTFLHEGARYEMLRLLHNHSCLILSYAQPVDNL